MKKKITLLLSTILFIMVLGDCIQGQTPTPKIHNQKFVSTFDFALLKIDENTYQKNTDGIQLLTKDTWEEMYIKSQKMLLFSRFDKNADIKMKKKNGSQLKQGLSKLLGADSLSLNWGFSLGDKDETILFPTGKVYLLFEKKLNMNARKKLLGSYKDYNIQYFEDVKVKQPSFKHTFWEGEEFMPEYIRIGIKRGIEMPEVYSRNEKEVFVSSPFAIIQLPYGREQEAFSIVDMVSKLKGVDLATPGFHALSKNLVKLHTGDPPPIPNADFFTSKNSVGRAWELFHPNNEVYDALFPNRFLCSDIRIAVFEANFHDNDNIRQDFIGFDAYDDDNDPRSPIYPPDINIHTDMKYVHGLEMSGVIGGHAQTYGWQCGVAPGTFIVPFRPFAMDNIDLSTREGTDEFVAEYNGDWWNALHRLWQLSFSDDVSIANFSGTANAIAFQVPYMMEWTNYFLQNGNYGKGIFFACSAGNNETSSIVAFPARMNSTFAVGWGNLNTNTVLGNHGSLLDITVDDGKWPKYLLNNCEYIAEYESGGSSVSCAVVSGTAALLKMAGTGVIDNATELESVLKYSARFSPSQLSAINNDGFHNEFGYGFLDAFHATKIAYKDFMRPIKIHKISFLPDGSSCLLIHAGFSSYCSNFANHASGVFWCLKQETDDQGIYWKHMRLKENTRHCEIVIDPISPMGTSLVGDYDGDGLDEIALQMDYWTEYPEYYFIVRKFNETTSSWEDLGQTVGTFPRVQFILPQQHGVSQIVSALLAGGTKADIVVLQGNCLNAMEYDVVADLWKPLGQQNFDISVLPADVRERIGDNFLTSIKTKHLQIRPFITYRGRQSLLVLSLVEKKNTLFYWVNRKRYLIVSVLSFNPVNGRFENAPLTTSGNTHSIILEADRFNVPEVRIDDFDGDNEPEALINVPFGGNNLILLDIQRTGVVNSETINLDIFSSRRSGVPFIIESGDVDGDGQAELAFLSGNGNNNVTRFLDWDASTRSWSENLNPLAHNRKNNRATRLLLGDFNSDGVSEVGMLLEKPHGNIFVVFQMQNGVFKEFGLW